MNGFREIFSSAPVLRAAMLLVGSNVFMTFAWYGHLRNLRGRPLLIAIAASWSIALFEYMLQVPANRIGSTALTLAQLKVMQEVITLIVFVPFAVLYYEAAREDRLFVGGSVSGGGGVFRFPG